MTIKYFLLISGSAILAFASCDAQKKESKGKGLSSQMDSVSYGIGLSIGQNIKKDFSEVDPDLVATGIRAALKNDSSIMKLPQAQMVIQRCMQEKSQAKGKANLEKGKKFLEENGKKAGVVTLPSGLQYQVIKTGPGAKPVATDKVSVHYNGTLIDGTVFDSSVQRGQPAQFPVNQVIPGWTEALQLMTVGSKWKLWIPANLAYGERSPGGTIGPNEMLIFDVELLSIDK